MYIHPFQAIKPQIKLIRDQKSEFVYNKWSKNGIILSRSHKTTLNRKKLVKFHI